MEFPAHLIWLLRGREALADDGLRVLPGVESLIEMRVNFSRICFFRSLKNEIRNTKYLCPYSNPKLIKLLQSSSDSLEAGQLMSGLDGQLQPQIFSLSFLLSNISICLQVISQTPEKSFMLSYIKSRMIIPSGLMSELKV